VTKLWEVIPGFMSEYLLEQYEYDELDAAEVRTEVWDFLEKPVPCICWSKGGSILSIPMVATH
jgi:hypothetical protein